MRRTVTIKDVAARANVSASTVSYVINGKHSISDDVSNRVKRIINELGYRPNRIARKLVTNVSGQIGLYATDPSFLRSSIFFSDLSASIWEEISGTHFNLTIQATNDKNSFSVDQISNEVDGAILICPTDDEEYAQKIINSSIPIVLIGRPEKYADKINYVDNDNVSITHQMTEYLLQLGHTNILLLNGPENYTVSKDRISGYEMALRESLFDVHPHLIHYHNYAITDNLETVTNAIRNKGVTAILAADDTLAVSSLNTVYASGLSVPDDISIVCLSETYFSQNYRPKITGVYPNTDKLGKDAVQKVLDLLNKRLIRPSHSIIDYTVNIRESSARKPK